MGATLSQPLIPEPLLPRSSIKAKPSKRPRFRLRLRIRWKKKSSTLPEIRALFPESLGHHDDHRGYRESKFYDSSSTEEGDEEKFFLLNSCTCTSAASSTELPVPTSPVLVADKSSKRATVSSPEGEIPNVNDTLSSSWARHPSTVFILTEKTLPDPPPPEIVSPADRTPSRQQMQLTDDTFTKKQLPVTADVPVEDARQEEHDDVSNCHFDSDSDSVRIQRERPHTPPPWDSSLTGYGSILEISRPFRARRVFEHPLVEGHFLANMGDFVSSGGPLAAEERRKMWRVSESAGGEGKKSKGLKSRGSNAVKKERGKGKKSKKLKTKTNVKRMSEWRRWKPLPNYPACTDVAQRASTWADTGGDDRAWVGAWREVGEELKDWEYQGEDEKEKGKEEDEEDAMGQEENRENEEEEEEEENAENEQEEDIEEAIKKFLEMKIPVDMESLYRLRASFAETGKDTAIIDSAAGEGAEGEMKEEMEGDQGEPSPLVESLFFADIDIEGFEFLVKEEDEGGGMSDTEVAVRSGSGGDASDEIEIGNLSW